MALWTTSYPVDAGDRDPSFAWHDADLPSAGLDDSQHDLFTQFLDFEAGHGASSATVGGEPFYLDQNTLDGAHHQNGESSTTSSGVSTADDFDFLSGSSHAGTAVGYEVDPSALAMFAQDPAAVMYAATNGGAAVSDTELERLEGISLHSPKKTTHGTAAEGSPPPSHVEASTTSDPQEQNIG
ncbi:hypothetical protein NQ176_g9624 [Zarea fungicola]|uniref:Uncharacterized protein n=1 Tax=Zarea fungicola TaxID=93591 RepID=A0ACC1MLK3_9HYPO|nr:hypothetical protein NQ176_g9624 [Lecanicillium fungicola]